MFAIDCKTKKITTNMRFTLLVLSLIAIPFLGTARSFSKKQVDENLNFCIQQCKLMGQELVASPDRLPKSLGKDGKLETSKSDWWCSGFYPGVLWYLFQYSNDLDIKNLAQDMTARLEREKNNKGTHDLGFMMYCSFGNGYRLTSHEQYKEVLIASSKSLCNRYHEKVGLIKSWDWSSKWKYPVIIDNMMNLEMLFWASKVTGDPSYKNIAISHANLTMKNHFRKDNSCYHVVSYNPETGDVEAKNTHQGYSDESSWARGQAWALYGYTMCYRETKDVAYLKQAQKVAQFILNHPNLPQDGIPYWDFNAPNIPNEMRDASAGAIFASAFIELSDYVGKKEGKRYLSMAETILSTLSSPSYRANLGENGNFILKHSVGSKPHNSEVDVPLTYADYYYVEALLRLKYKL